MPRYSRRKRGGSKKNWSRHASSAGTAGKQVVCFFEGPLASPDQEKILSQLYDSREKMASTPVVAVTPHAAKPVVHLSLGSDKSAGEHINTAAKSVQKAAQKTANNITSQAKDVANKATDQVQSGIDALTNAVKGAAQKVSETVGNLGTNTQNALQTAAKNVGLKKKVEAVQVAADHGNTHEMKTAAHKAAIAAHKTMAQAGLPAQQPAAALAGMQGGRRRTRRAGKRRRRRGGRTKRRGGYKRGSLSRTHSGKDFETSKRSKKYRRRRFKRLFGRETIGAPLFPFAGGRRRRRRGGRRTRRR